MVAVDPRPPLLISQGSGVLKRRRWTRPPEVSRRDLLHAEGWKLHISTLSWMILPVRWFLHGPVLDLLMRRTSMSLSCQIPCMGWNCHMSAVIAHEECQCRC